MLIRDASNEATGEVILSMYEMYERFTDLLFLDEP